MKNFSRLSITLVSIVIFCSSQVRATVGGEKVLYNFVYNSTDESVYYMRQDFGGRGCPPELFKTSLNSEQSIVVYSCDTGESLSQQKVESEISKITNGFKSLIPINLKSNAITVDITFVKNENYSFEIAELYRRHFTATIYQNGKKIKEFPLTGCRLDQPFVFQGYSIPGFNKKIMLLVSAKGDCNEGGYIQESMHVLGDLIDINKTEITNFYKGPSALKLNEGSLVVYEADTGNGATTVGSSTTVQVSSSTEAEVERKSFWMRFIDWIKNLF